MKNKKIMILGAGLMLLASTTMAYGGYGRQANNNGNGCYGDVTCMVERQAEMQKQNPNLNINDMQRNRQGRGYGRNQVQNNNVNGQARQNFKINDGTCTELDDIKNGPKYDLTEEEKEYISHMREEEKIARDVYIKLYEKWGIRTFDNIKNAEQRHMDSVKVLIDKYGLEDSMKSNVVGEFNNPEFQKLYNDLIEKGYKSEIDALQVGMTIEDVDIYDLEKFMSQSENKDLKTVFDNLNTGSFNHMKAFKRQLDSRNRTYEAQFITTNRMNNILNSKDTHTHNQNGNSNRQGNGCHGDQDCMNERMKENNNQGNRGNGFGVQNRLNNLNTSTEDGGVFGRFFNWFSFLKFW